MAEEIKKAEPIAKKKKGPEVDPFVASMLPESDKRMAGFSGTFAIFAIVLGFMASAYEAAVDEILFDNIESEDLSASMKIDEKKEEKKKEEKKSEKPRKKQGAGGKPRGKGQPNAPQTRGVLKMLTAKTSKSNFSAYNLMKDKNFAKDIDKVLKNVAGLQTSGKTELGSRRGSATGGFNDGYAEGGSGGIGDMLGGLMGGSAGGIGTSAKGTLKAPSQRDIDMGSGDGSRSKADIMAVINQRMPGLRRIYNQHLKTNPGLTGKVTIKFTIAPGGDIVSINIVSSTTGDSKFDEAIKNAVQTWKWKAIKSGNTTPTIPFNFSE
ncbi:MAG: TonB family protein [Fibromonadaceae bacterium]|jgi:TonB family protein|nr:TonB family protein [Fibromonadaceae bacterium]